MCGALQCSQKTERTQYGDRSLVRMAYTEIRYHNRVVTCHTASIDLGSEELDPGLVPSGAKCGNDMVSGVVEVSGNVNRADACSFQMCTGRKCVPITDVLKQKPCENVNCFGNGVRTCLCHTGILNLHGAIFQVCNNFGHCHCNNGFGGPDCGSIGLGGSVDSGPASLGGKCRLVWIVLSQTRASHRMGTLNACI